MEEKNTLNELRLALIDDVLSERKDMNWTFSPCNACSPSVRLSCCGCPRRTDYDVRLKNFKQTYQDPDLEFLGSLQKLDRIKKLQKTIDRLNQEVHQLKKELIIDPLIPKF